MALMYIVTNQTRNAMYNQRALNVSSAAVQCRSLTPSFILFLDLGFSLYSIYTSVTEIASCHWLVLRSCSQKFLLIYLMSK